MKKIKTAIFAALTGFAIAGTANAAYLDKNDEGIYAIYNAGTNQVLNVGIRLQKFSKHWEIEATYDGGQQWVKLSDANGKVARFTNTSRRTLARLFDAHSNKDLVKRITTRDKLETDCIDAGEDMFCRFKAAGEEQVSFGWRQKQNGEVQFYDLIKSQ
ncbi:hypothetical protein PTQ27_00145 [Mannheimia sp. AT1]|uniref:Uncharacterized protein n=1 Tax=Mannheimia cairinae TaxID=3025936 RepID=A0ABT5ML31_9PAST|nr:hypothetical protein [Mannheimia cairinae]MDD0822889.1 hypothetical protein [Mannheimia cairinae]MDD0826083.1 hypothetical protein [Mannheimia cairinae]